MSKRIIYLSFYFKPDLCAGSFRNSPLAFELSKQLSEIDKSIIVDVFTTLPNRYSTFSAEAPSYEELDNLRIHRINIPGHKSGFIDQIFTFKKFYSETLKLSKEYKYDLVFASSSRLFTAYLGYKIARMNNTKLYLDIRDIFVDTINDVLNNKILKLGVLPILKYVENRVFSNATHINLISKGFKTYFEKYNKPNYSYFTNGIDPEFLEINQSESLKDEKNSVKSIVYAGNIGEGQGLHKIIPKAAKLLGEKYKFIVIGDGGAKSKLISELNNLNVKNVELRNPVKRDELIKEYLNADFLFLHLNNYAAFEKVLPSKIFELGVFSKPILAGVNGYSREFILENLKHAFLFDSGDAESLVLKIQEAENLKEFNADEFKSKYNRAALNAEMAKSIINYL